MAESYGSIGSAMWEEGDINEARQIFQENQAMHAKVGNVRSEAIAISRVGLLDLTAGDVEAGLMRLQTAADVFRAENERHMLTAVLLNRGLGLILRGAFVEAKSALDESYDIFTELGIVYDMGHVRTLLGFADLHLGDFVQASETAQAGIELAQQSNYQRTIAAGLLIQAKAALAQGKFSLAEQLAQHSLSVYQTHYERQDEIALAWATLAGTARLRGDKTAAFAYLTEAVQLSSALDSFMEQVVTLAVGALFLLDADERELAACCYQAVLVHGYFQKSAWFAAIAGNELAAAGLVLGEEAWSLRDGVAALAKFIGRVSQK